MTGAYVRPPAAGLCSSCIHARQVTSARGSAFVLCDRSRDDAGYPKYPRLPVAACAGHEECTGGHAPEE